LPRPWRCVIDIISKKSGPRREDAEAKAHVQRNWGTIEKLADQISGGSYSANKNRTKKEAPKASGLIIVDQAPRRAMDDPEPYLRISANGRVVIADKNSARQMHFLGQLKRQDGVERFVIATAENGFVSPVEPEIHAKIADLADRQMTWEFTEEDLAEELKTRLGLT
jgi:hypothetical protein